MFLFSCDFRNPAPYRSLCDIATILMLAVYPYAKGAFIQTLSGWKLWYRAVIANVTGYVAPSIGGIYTFSLALSAKESPLIAVGIVACLDMVPSTIVWRPSHALFAFHAPKKKALLSQQTLPPLNQRIVRLDRVYLKLNS